jgi:hypothetical protein
VNDVRLENAFQQPRIVHYGVRASPHVGDASDPPWQFRINAAKSKAYLFVASKCSQQPIRLDALSADYVHGRGNQKDTDGHRYAE